MSAAARRLPVLVFSTPSALTRHGWATFTHSQTLCVTPLLSEAGQLSCTLQKRTHSSLPPTAETPRRAYKNIFEIRQHLNPPDQNSRTVVCARLPKFALEDDIRELFEESGFDVHRVITIYQGDTGLNIGIAWVVLADDHAAETAVRELNGAPLFDRTIVVKPAESPTQIDRGTVNLYWGWTASRDPALQNVSLRPPQLHPPKGIFKPVREGRRVAVDMSEDNHLPMREMYALFHNYNVDSVTKPIIYQRKLNPSRRKTFMIDFTTRDEADKAVHVFDGYTHKGVELAVNKYQIPLKYLGASWDSGRPGEHFSGRDQGDAVGTNFEHVQEELLAKAILGNKDRKIWVPSHTY